MRFHSLEPTKKTFEFPLLMSGIHMYVCLPIYIMIHIILFTFYHVPTVSELG